jgi:predicted dehydrogenase
MKASAAKVGVIGCGNISGIYFRKGQELQTLDIVACADLIMERAKSSAKEYNLAKACTPEELLADPSIEIVLNLTIPKAHAEVALAAIESGKSVYNEKPLAVTREDGKRILDSASERGVLVGCAPDTFLGAGIQTCRKLIDDGWIGKPIAATAFMTCHGHESWHPDPEFYYRAGGGPMLDMGPYYLTAMINLMGPVRRVTGSTQLTFPTRTITSEPKYGTVIKVDVPTHVVGVLDFAEGAVGTIITSFDVWAADLPRIEVYGTEGSLSVPDPNTFGGEVKVFRHNTKQWDTISHTHGYPENSRGLGVADMAAALHSGRPHRASGQMAYHVLDVMHAIHDASRMGKHIELNSTCARPAAMPMNLLPGAIDE